jgi:hypothetical protein
VRFIGAILLAGTALSGPPNGLPPSIQFGARFPTGGFEGRLAVADVSGDGLPDAIVSTWSANLEIGHIAILLGDGKGRFSAAQRYPAGAIPYEVVAGDFNGDGIEDIAVTDGGPIAANLLLFFGLGGGRFRPAPYHIGLSTYDIAASDFDGNGTIDLAATFSDGVLLLLGRGNGTFNAQDPIRERTATGITVADMNDDGKPDIVVSNSPSSVHGSVSVFLNDGHGRFRVPLTYPTGAGVGVTATGVNPLFVRTTDLNGDGHLDVVTSNSDSSDVSVLYGDGTGRLASPRIYKSPEETVNLEVRDVNGDGWPDVVTASEVFLNLGDALARPISFGSAGASDVAVADVNGDGIPDFVLGNAFGGFLRVLEARTPTRPVIVPRLVGRTLSAARAILRRDGSSATPVTFVHRKDRRVVVRQYPRTRTRILSGAPVGLVVNAGPRR